MQWQNPNGSTTNGVVIEDGAGNRLGTATNPLNVTGGGGGGATDSSAGLAGGASNIGGSASVAAIGVLAGFPVATAGYQSLALECVSTFVGVVSFEGSNDNWTSFYPILASRLDSATVAPASAVSNPTAGALWDIPAKFAQLRVRASSYTSGSGGFQWVLKAGPVARFAVDQGAGNASAVWAVQGKTAASGGVASHTPIVSTASTNITQIKTSLGQVYGVDLSNNAATWAYFKLFNKASAPVLGTDTPVAVYGVPPGGTKFVDFAAVGLYFSAGIFYAITQNPALTDATALAAASTIIGAIHTA
jgi:hypothetical protein